MRKIEDNRIAIEMAIQKRAEGKASVEMLQGIFDLAWENEERRGTRIGTIIETSTWKAEGQQGMQYGYAYPTYLLKGEMFLVYVGDNMIEVNRSFLFPVDGACSSPELKKKVETMKKDVGL